MTSPSNVVPLPTRPKSTPKSSSSSRVAFTEKNVLRLPLPATGDRIVYDTRSPLAVRLTAAGARSYVLYRRIAGRPSKLTIGPVDEITLAAASGKRSGS